MTTLAKLPDRTVRNLHKFSVLERKVNETFEQGLARAKEAVEVEKTRTYLEVGRLIDRHLLLNEKRAGYGDKVIPRLAETTGKSRTLLYDCLRLARQKAIVQAPVQLLPWTQEQILLSVKTPQRYLELSQRTRRNRWTSRELAAVVRKRRKGPGALKDSGFPEPKRGELYHYRIVQSEVPGKPLQLDLGFDAFVDMPSPSSRFKEGDIVISTALDRIKGRGGKYRVEKAGAVPFGDCPQ